MLVAPKRGGGGCVRLLKDATVREWLEAILKGDYRYRHGAWDTA